MVRQGNKEGKNFRSHVVQGDRASDCREADDLGGGVFKKRLSNNQSRSIILARGGKFWVYQYLFAKQDRANIDDNELAAFKHLARIYAGMAEEQAELQIADGHWIEICRGELEQAR